MSKGLFVVEPLNLTFMVMLAIFELSAVVAVNRLKDKTEKYRYRFVLIVYSVVFAVFVLYKLLLPFDTEYMRIYAQNWGAFTYWNELPLNPCNISLIANIVAIRTRKRALLSCCFFLSILGPLCALLMPLSGFSGYSLFTIHMFGFYFVHMALLMTPILFVGLKIYMPRFQDVIPSVLLFTLMAAIVFVIDSLLVNTGLCLSANYFFCMYTDGNPILALFYRLIPVPFLYLLPGIFLFIPVGFGIVGISSLAAKLYRAQKKRRLSQT